MANQGPKSPDERPDPSPKHKDKHKCQMGIHYGALAATKWTNTSLTSKGMFFFFRNSIQTVVYLGTKLLGGSDKYLDAANPFQRTLYSLPQVCPDLACPSGSSRR